MSKAPNRIELLKSKAKLLQKAKKKAGKDIQLKAAFEIIAKHAGYLSWRDLKENLEANQIMNFPISSAYWNTWYSNYDDAKKHIQDGKGYLLPYQKHFFICDSNYLERLGVSIGDPDLEKVGRNWVEPLDTKAWERLAKKIEESLASKT